MIAITGFNGDVGSMLLSMFVANGLECKKYDGELDGVDRILHLAAKSPPATYGEIVDSNIIYLKELIKKAEENGVRELIFFSAASIYGSLDVELATEDSPFQTPDIYGLSKALGEEMLKSSNLKVLVIRFPAVLGLRNNTNILARWYNKMKKNETIVYTNGCKLFNNFITIESIFNFLREFKFCEKFDIVNLASQRTMSISEITAFLKNTIGSSSQLIDGGSSPSFAISTEKAEEKYGFMPQDPQGALLSWIQKKETL